MKEAIECYINLRLVRNGEEFDNAFGPGIANLLRKVAELGSLSKAAKSMGMAYSKAWRIMRNTERQFGFEMIDRDGPRGSSITEKGTQILKMYDAMQKAANDAARKVIEKTELSF